MRLRTFGLVMVVMSFGGLSYGQTSAVKQTTASLLGGAPDPASVLAHSNTFGGNDTLFQPSLSDRFSDQRGIAHSERGRTRLALATPAIVQRNSPAASTTPLVASYATDSPLADSYSARPQEQQPSLWLMGGVILVLLGYQLRRKHRFLRPHRFNAL